MEALNDSEIKERAEIARARREGSEAETSLQLALEREELAEAAERSAQVNLWASGALFGSSEKPNQ